MSTATDGTAARPENAQPAASADTKAERQNVAPAKPGLAGAGRKLIQHLRRHCLLWLIAGAVGAMLVFALLPRDTLFVADAHSEIVTLEQIDGKHTSIPLGGAVFCMLPGSFPSWARSGDGRVCGTGMMAGLAPVGANALEPANGSRAVISRIGDGPLRITLAAGDPKGDKAKNSAGRLVGDGSAWDLPSLVFISFDTIDQRAGRVVTFRAAAEIGGQGEAQRLLYEGSLEVFRRGALIDRFVSRRERLRTGDTIQFFNGRFQRAMVNGIAAAAPGDDGGLRVTIQATGSPAAFEFLNGWGQADGKPDKALTYGAKISRFHADPYKVEAGFFDNLLSDPVFIYLSGLLAFVAVVASVLSIFDWSNVSRVIELPPESVDRSTDRPAASESDEDGGPRPTAPGAGLGLLLICLATVPWTSDARAEFRQVNVRGTPNLGQGFLVASGGLCYAIMPRHLLLRPDGIIAGSAVLAPEGSRGKRVGARLYAEFPFDAVLLETEGLPPGGCGPSIHSWRPDVRAALQHSGTVVLRSINADGGVRTLPLTIKSTSFTGIRIAPAGKGFIQQTMSGSLIVREDDAMAMLLSADGDYSGSGMNIDQILASARVMLGAPATVRKSKPVPSTIGNVLSLAAAGASLVTSSAAPYDSDSGAGMLLAAPEEKRQFRAAAPRGASLEIDLAGDTARPIGCIRLDFTGIPPKERPRSVSIGLSALTDGGYFPSDTIAVSSIADVTDRQFGLPQRARRLFLQLQPSQHPEGILAMRRLIVFEAAGGSGGCL